MANTTQIETIAGEDYTVTRNAAGDIVAQALHNPDTSPPENEWWITANGFIGRMGMDGLAIGASAHPVCVALRSVLASNPYVDLAGAQVSGLLDLLIANSLPAADANFPGSGPVDSTKKTAWLNTAVPVAQRYRVR